MFILQFVNSVFAVRNANRCIMQIYASVSTRHFYKRSAKRAL